MNRVSFVDKETRVRLTPVVAVGLVVIAGILAFYVAQPQLLRLLDLKTYDLLLPLRKLDSGSQVPVIVDIDEKSLALYGQWPWPRYLIAELINRLDAAGVAAIGLDIIFAEEDRSSPRVLHQCLKRDIGADVSLWGLPRGFWDYDALLAHSLEKKNVVLGFYARFNDGTEELELPPAVGVAARNKPGSAMFERRCASSSCFAKANPGGIH